MKTIFIKTAKNAKKALALLEKKGLVRVLRPSAKALNTRTETGAVDVLYRGDKRFGGHCLMGVGKRNTEIEFSFHPDNEDIILLKPASRKYKPLFFVASLLRSGEFSGALAEGRLAVKDLLAVKLEYNNPETMFFTVLKDTVHCEITVPGPGQHPVFFVSEPSKLGMNRVKTGEYGFRLKRKR